MRTLAVWQPLDISTQLIEASWDIQDQYTYSWRDTLMITASLFLDCKYLLSEDLQHDQKINNLTIINPFLVDLEELTE